MPFVYRSHERPDSLNIPNSQYCHILNTSCIFFHEEFIYAFPHLNKSKPNCLIAFSGYISKERTMQVNISKNPPKSRRRALGVKMNPSAKIFRANSMVIPTKKTYSPIWNGNTRCKGGEYRTRHDWWVNSPLAQEYSSDDGVAFRETLRYTRGWLLPRRPNPGRL